ncbi:hypothetical protein TNIN_258921 [Trichonephila inaurata madagascariensis]|uniref:Uncharacterized protein n=1 Tax=Trichonephila inaurata madagascariensis TaxID=2747483 RepID=A0A8X6YFV0_9ARAC|nr:hypothetical protein TNIN_258921 [Trichonephila inaurata madagascariensis]
MYSPTSSELNTQISLSDKSEIKDFLHGNQNKSPVYEECGGKNYPPLAKNNRPLPVMRILSLGDAIRRLCPMLGIDHVAPQSEESPLLHCLELFGP